MRQPASGQGGALDAPAEEAPALAWVEAYRRRHGRAPRVLHIGNIANNAYNNAKILNRAGFDCDVICYDYYHIMACPEWEDADFSGDVGDHFRPRWWRVNLRGFRRPEWFVQGPMDLCIDYLVARRANQGERARRIWRTLQMVNGTRKIGLEDPRALAHVWMMDIRRVAQKLLDEEVVERRLRDWYRAWTPRSAALGAAASRGAAAALVLHRTVARGGRRALAEMARLRARRVRGSDPLMESPEELFAYAQGRYASAFPERADSLTSEDAARLLYCLPAWKRLLSCYDIVIGYATDPILPFLSRHRYFALEHGTLREIPFRENWLGRLTAVAYHCAEHVFVTNYDCMDNARSLAGERCSFINHPYDEDHGMTVSGVRETREELQRALDSNFLVFFPTRHDWVPGTGYADKANDRLLRAIASLRREGHAIGLVCCRWGSNVRQSVELIAELGLEAHVLWREPMGVISFERMCGACDMVADQFQIGSFGGVTFKAMAVSAPVCTYIDNAAVGRIYPQPPPVLNCRTEQEIADAIRECLAHPERLAAIAAAGREWIKTHHAAADTVATQAEQFRSFLNAG